MTTLDRQHTISSPVSIAGVGLHTGVKVNVRLCPAPPNTGIVFKRTDLDGFAIEANVHNVARVAYATSLMKQGVLISTTEHLLSALAASGLDNVVVETDNLELPILDGSALPFLKLIQQAGLKRQRAARAYAKVLTPIEVVDGAKGIAVYPSDVPRITYSIDFAHPLIGNQTLEFQPDKDSYEEEIAPARTFGFAEEVEMLRRNNLIRGGSLENAVVLTRDGIVNPEGLRFPDEFCRHKILDVVGDLALFGHPIIGHVVAKRGGHAMHVALLTRLLRDETSWTLVKSSELEQKRQAARVTLDKFKTSSKEAWPDVKPGIQAAMNDVETAYRRAAPQFK
ncbi:MAG: UDP-3-O-acyl-N-acetylglucosamine deacetylase [Terriglobia bacterium]|jgi:UDP-3-O-[3-hydroxymyristoyl] N-acetylglucosamine deacetylase